MKERKCNRGILGLFFNCRFHIQELKQVFLKDHFPIKNGLITWKIVDKIKNLVLIFGLDHYNTNFHTEKFKLIRKSVDPINSISMNKMYHNF